MKSGPQPGSSEPKGKGKNKPKAKPKSSGKLSREASSKEKRKTREKNLGKDEEKFKEKFKQKSKEKRRATQKKSTPRISMARVLKSKIRSHKPQRLRIDQRNHTQVRVSRQFVREWIQLACFKIQEVVVDWPSRATRLTVVFLDPEPAKEINFQFKKKKYATDILSFAPIEPLSLGELVVCPDVVVRQAAEHGHSFQLELGYLLIHGILHLLGFEHEFGGRRATLMYKIQDEVFAKLSDERLSGDT